LIGLNMQQHHDVLLPHNFSVALKRPTGTP
jgi:hypothetical protein